MLNVAKWLVEVLTKIYRVETMRNLNRFLLALILSIWLPSVSAATATGSMLNTATVLSACVVATVGFTTNYDPNAGSANTTTATVTTTCTLGASGTITLGQGANADTGSTNAAPLRRLSDGAGTPNYISYNLYQDNAYSTVWGNTAGTGVSVTGSGVAAIKTVYARLPASQNVPAGVFTDTVVVTLTY